MNVYMNTNFEQAKERLDSIIRKARTDLYKPIQIAEVLRKSRLEGDIDIFDKSTYQNRSLKWRDKVTLRLSQKRSTSSARYQHDLWNETAMPPNILAVLDQENKRTQGSIEKYIYKCYVEKQGFVSDLIRFVEDATSESFSLPEFLDLFVASPGLRRSVDKAYEIVTYSLFEVIVTTLEARVSVSIPEKNLELLQEFADLGHVLLGLSPNQTEWTQLAHVYRVGVTNAADRGLDMWTNFGPAVQVKHLTLDNNLAKSIVDQIESDCIVVVCKDSHSQVIEMVTQQISWGNRIRAIVRESELVEWYEKCLRGNFASQLAEPLLKQLLDSLRDEFPQVSELADFLKERGYQI